MKTHTSCLAFLAALLIGSIIAGGAVLVPRAGALGASAPQMALFTIRL